VDEFMKWYFAGLFDCGGGVYATLTSRGETSTLLTLNGVSTRRGSALFTEVGGGKLDGFRAIFTGRRASAVGRLLLSKVGRKRPELEVFLALRESLEMRALTERTDRVPPNLAYRAALVQNLKEVRKGIAAPITSFVEWTASQG